MKNIDTDKINRMLDIFTDLDEEYQDKAIVYLNELLVFEQSARKNAYKNISDMNVSEKDIEQEKRRINKRVIDMANIVSKLDDENKAKMAIVIESLMRGAFTKKDEISISVNSKEISLEDFIAQQFSGVDYNKIKTNHINK